MRVPRKFVCRICDHAVTVYVDQEDEFSGAITGECSNKHKRSFMVEVPQVMDEEGGSDGEAESGS